MIRKIDINDFESIYNLGQTVNSNYINLYNLNDIINDGNQKIYVYIIEKKVVAFVHITVSFEEADIVDIVVLERFRHQNIGTKLINFVIVENNLSKLNLEVRESNAIAIAFYQKLEFKIIRKIKKYYRNEDALFMVKEVKNKWKMYIF